MNKKTLLLILLLTILACSSKTEKPTPDKQLEGWAGNPRNPNETPFDYFYMHSVGKAHKYVVAIRHPNMKSTCIDAATRYSKGDLIGKMVFDSIQVNGNLSDRAERYGVLLVREYAEKIKEVQIRGCQPTSKLDSGIPITAWKECECIIYAHIPGGKNAIIARAKELDRE